MKRLLIALGILVISSGFALLEYFFFPNRVQELKSSVLSSEMRENSSYFYRIQSGDVPISEISTEDFGSAGIPEVTIGESSSSEHIFGLILIDPSADEMSVMKTDFFEGEKSTVLLRIYEIFPKNMTTLSRLFSRLQEKFQEKFQQDIESNVHETNQFGLASFYVNPAANPEKVFLLAGINDRILGFEYLKKNHEKLFPLIKKLAPPIH